MKIALIGYGKMGKIIHEIAENRGHEIISTIDPYTKEAKFQNISSESVKEADVCIEFTNPGSVINNLKSLIIEGKNIVVGTTGWFNQLEKIKAAATSGNISIVYGTNFSVGMNIFLKSLIKTCEIFNKFPEYDVAGFESHHNQKIDSPSGTAITIAGKILSKIDRKSKVVYDKISRQIKEEELHFSSLRCGNIPGTHSVLFDSLADTIELKHTARSREGFALGAVLAAEFLNNNEGIFNFEQVIEDIIS